MNEPKQGVAPSPGRGLEQSPARTGDRRAWSGPPCGELGVVIVTFNAADEITACLESLAAAAVPGMRLVVVDNASTDDTVAVIRGWAEGTRPCALPDTLPFALAPAPKPVALTEIGPDLKVEREGHDGAAVTLIHAGVNGGFASGVNLGLAHLARDPCIGHFWVLNPDSMVPPGAVGALVAHLADAPRYALMGGRVLYLTRPDRIQIDGGRLNRCTGVSGNLNLNRPHPQTPPPDPAQLDFITGASMVASRAFYERAGPMAEEYFLYYEEVDWAMRRGDLPLAYCPGLVVYHRGGTAIGSPVWGRGRASEFSLYFKHRGRMRFLRRFSPWSLPLGLAYSFGQAGRMLWRRDPRGATTVLGAAMGLPMPAAVRARLSPEALALAQGRARRRPAGAEQAASQEGPAA